MTTLQFYRNERCIKAYKEVGEIVHDLILINYDNRPKHEIQTAQAIKQRKKTNNIPILFLDEE